MTCSGTQRTNVRARNRDYENAADRFIFTDCRPRAAASGAAAKTYLRGGDRDEIGIMLNGQKLFDPFHVRDYQSVFSVIDSRAIEGVEVYTGGFPVRFGNRMSGMVLMDALEPVDRRHVELGLSVYNTSLLFAGREDNKQWLFSARRGNLDLVINEKLGSPSYYDVFAEFAWEPNPDMSVSFNALFADDRVEIVLESDPEELERVVSHDVRQAHARHQAEVREPVRSAGTDSRSTAGSRYRVRPDPGSAQSQGVEITLDRRSGSFNWWATYVFSEVRDRIDGRQQPRSWDQPHAFQGGLSFSNEKWDWAVAANVHSGWPSTELSLLESGVDDEGEPEFVAVPGVRNAGRYPSFASIDVRLGRKWKLLRSRLTAFVEISNVTNRRNQCCLDWELEEDENTGEDVFERGVDYWMPLLPAVGGSGNSEGLDSAHPAAHCSLTTSDPVRPTDHSGVSWRRRKGRDSRRSAARCPDNPIREYPEDWKNTLPPPGSAL